MLRKYVSSVEFRAEAYLNGTGRGTKEDDQTFFWERFRKWRTNIHASEEEIEAILERLEKWTQMRVEGIMEKSHRNYYGECAALRPHWGSPGVQGRAVGKGKGHGRISEPIFQTDRISPGASGIRDGRYQKKQMKFCCG